MSIITWVENGKKQFAVCDAKYFDHVEQDFPVYECRHKRFQAIVAFSEEEVVMVSGDRKRYRRLQPAGDQADEKTNAKSGRRRLSA